jgi:GT2 family glycosyltransferase
VVVVHDGRPFLRDTFRGLAAQTRPIDDVVIVDTGSTDGSADWARARLGNDAVLAVRGQFGRAVMSVLRDERAAGMEWLWLLHDDSAPEPDALEQLLAEAESRTSASILGPKLVSWNDPRRLSEVGWSIDRTGRAVSPIEDDEIDQGQHDQLREVFFVSTAGMLVRRSALLAAGGFDERISAFRDDLDLCWRSHLVGGRVLVVPAARVRHFAAAASRARRTRAVSLPRYLTERHTTMALLKATRLRRLPLVLALALVGALARVAGLALTGRPGDAAQVLWAWGWNVKELPITLVNRRRIQSRRKVDDSLLAGLHAPGGQRLRSLLRGWLDLLYGEVGEHVAQPTFKEEEDTPNFGASMGRVLARHPVGFMIAGFAVLMAVSLRSLLIAPGIGGGSLALWPSTAQALLSEYRSVFHPGGLGSTDPAAPSLALLGLFSTITLGKTLLAEKLLLWLALPLAAATCTRALRVLVPQLPARTVAGLLYASSPLAIGALAQGRIGALIFLILAPPALAQVLLAFRADQPREPWRPALRFALLAAVSVAMYPPALVLLGLVVLLAIAIAVVRVPSGAGGRPALRSGRPAAVHPATTRAVVVRQSVFLAAGYAMAVGLLLPWSGQLFSGTSSLRDAAVGQLTSPSMLDLLQLRPGGPGLPSWLVGPVYPALALAAVGVAPVERRMQAFWLALGLAVAAFLAAIQASDLSSAFTDWPGGMLVLGAVAWAGAAGLALAGFGSMRVGFALSPRRVAATALALLAVAGSVLVLAHVARGAWSPLRPVREHALPATVTGTEARVLWLAGRPDRGVDFAVTGPDGRTLLDSGKPAPPAAAEALETLVTDIVQARTHRVGAMLRMFNIGYVVVRRGPGADRLAGLVGRQQDLTLRPSPQAALYQGPSVSPGGWVIRGEAPTRIQDLVTGPGLVPLRGPGAPATVRGPATVVLPVPAAKNWRATVSGAELQRTAVLGWEQGFIVPAGVSGSVRLERLGQDRRDALLLVQGLLALAAVATMLRPTRAAPPAAPITLDDTTTGDIRIAELTRQGAP